jgi:hypothetical protein
MLLGHIHTAFTNLKATFDLEDCDRILRVQCTGGHISPCHIINLLKELGYNADALNDEIKAPNTLPH